MEETPEIECNNCIYYEAEDNYCKAFECNGMDCPPLPCECEDETKWKIKLT